MARGKRNARSSNRRDGRLPTGNQTLTAIRGDILYLTRRQLFAIQRAIGYARHVEALTDLGETEWGHLEKYLQSRIAALTPPSCFVCGQPIHGDRMQEPRGSRHLHDCFDGLVNRQAGGAEAAIRYLPPARVKPARAAAPPAIEPSMVKPSPGLLALPPRTPVIPPMQPKTPPRLILPAVKAGAR